MVRWCLRCWCRTIQALTPGGDINFWVAYEPARMQGRGRGVNLGSISRRHQAHLSRSLIQSLCLSSLQDYAHKDSGLFPGSALRACQRSRR